jgi:hypothetical protein
MVVKTDVFFGKVTLKTKGSTSSHLLRLAVVASITCETSYHFMVQATQCRLSTKRHTVFHHSNVQELIIRVNGMGVNPSRTQTINFVIGMVNHSTRNSNTRASSLALQIDFMGTNKVQGRLPYIILAKLLTKYKLTIFSF